MEVGPNLSFLALISSVNRLALAIFACPVGNSRGPCMLTSFFRNEIGATNPETSKWVVEDGKVYKKDKKAANGREEQPMTPTECLYDLMIQIHKVHGHKGRDNFFNLVKTLSGSVKKAFCHQFVQVCCDKAESWSAGGHVPYGWQAPVKHRDAGERVNEVLAVDNVNAAVNIENPVSPSQGIQQDNQQFVSLFLSL